MAVIALAPAGAALCAGPQALVCGGVALLALGIGALMVQSADDDAEENLSGAQSGAEACSTCEPPQCGPLNDEIRGLRNEIENRYRDMEIDQYDLFNRAYSRHSPLVVNGATIGSWEGHVMQYEQKQTRLRNKTADARGLGCSITTPDADRWGSRSAPLRPNRIYQ